MVALDLTAEEATRAALLTIGSAIRRSSYDIFNATPAHCTDDDWEKSARRWRGQAIYEALCIVYICGKRKSHSSRLNTNEINTAIDQWITYDNSGNPTRARYHVRNCATHKSGVDCGVIGVYDYDSVCTKSKNKSLAKAQIAQRMSISLDNNSDIVWPSSLTLTTLQKPVETALPIEIKVICSLVLKAKTSPT